MTKINELLQLAKLLDGDTTAPLPSVMPKETNLGNSIYTIGDNYLIRTVTMITVGKLEQITDKEFLLSSASWVADTGRFHDTLKNGFPDGAEIEPFQDDVIVGRGALVDMTKWRHELPNKQQ